MRPFRTIGTGTALCGAAVLALSAAPLTAQEAAKGRPEKPQVVDLRTFRVSMPPGDGWKVKVDKEAKGVQFTKSKAGLLRQMSNKERITELYAGSDSVDLYYWRESEEEFVDGFFAWYASEQFPPWVKPEKKLVEWGGKKLYSMKYRENRIPGPSTELSVYLYLPPDAARSHRVFRFEYFLTLEKAFKGAVPSEEDMRRGIAVEPSLEPIQSLVESLELIDPLQAVPGPQGDMLRAAAAGNAEDLLRSIEAGADINATGPERGALSAAAYHGRREIVDLLLEKGAAVDLPDERGGTTPLLAAIIGGEPEIAVLLIEKKADVNRKIKMGNVEGVSPLMLAAATGHLDLTRAIIDAGADLEARTRDGESALVLAAANGWAEGAALLLEKGADVNARMNNGWTALMRAAGRRRSDIVGMLLENKAEADLKATADGWTALMMAVYDNQPDIVRALIDHGADVNARWAGDAVTALNGAVLSNLPEIAAILVKAGADVNVKMKDGRTPLIAAAEEGRVAIVKLLVENGADVNARTKKGRTALQIAMKSKKAEIVRLLQAAGAR
jgi:ankyrin repeat protein